MTPEEILQDLRDIHLPEQAADMVGGGLVLWPAALVLAALVLAAWLVWRRRSAWRREIIRHLDAIERDADRGGVLEGWTALAILLRRVAMKLHGRRDVAGLIGDDWLERLDHLFQTDVFSKGPGRGVATFPYSAAGENDDDALGRAADQLSVTIDAVRKHLPKLRAARWSS